MDPHVYPDPQLAPLTLPAAPGMGAPAPTFIAIEQLAAPDPATPFVAKTMFIRVAMSGAPCASVIGPTAPNFYLKADTGDVVLINDHSKLPEQTYSIYHRPGSDPRDFVADGIVDLESDNVFRITVTFQDPAGNYAWQLGIWNNDTGASRGFTWVVSGTLANTAQPWIDVQPTIRSWDVLVNNKGTAPFTVNSVSPAFPAGFALGPLPVSLNPGGSAPLTVTFTGSGNSPGSNGAVAATANLAITPADGTAGTGAGHNRQLSVSASDDLTVRTLTLEREGVDPTLWPQLSCSQANEASLKDSSLRLDPNREILFQGNGSMTSAGDLRFLTGTPAATEKLRVLANGNVGIGTPNPSSKLEVTGDWNGQEGALRLTGDKPTIKFAGGPVTGNRSWILHLGGDGPGNLEFFTQGATPSSWTNVMTLTPSGLVGIGTATPFSPLWVQGNSGSTFVHIRDIASGGPWGIMLGVDGTGGKIVTLTNHDLQLGAGTGRTFMNIKADGSVGIGIGQTEPAAKLDVGGAVHASSFPTSSDKRFKTNIVPLTDALEKIDVIRGVVFNWNELYESLGRSTGRREIGVIAQDVEDVFPELVSTWHEDGYKAVDYGRLTAVLVEAIKELKAKVEGLERRLELSENPSAIARNN